MGSYLNFLPLIRQQIPQSTFQMTQILILTKMQKRIAFLCYEQMFIMTYCNFSRYTKKCDLLNGPTIGILPHIVDMVF